MFWNSELIKQKRAMEQLDEIISSAIESLRNNQKQLNEDTPITIEKLKERLTIIRQRNLTEEISLVSDAKEWQLASSKQLNCLKHLS